MRFSEAMKSMVAFAPCSVSLHGAVYSVVRKNSPGADFRASPKVLEQGRSKQ